MIILTGINLQGNINGMMLGIRGNYTIAKLRLNYN